MHNFKRIGKIAAALAAVILVLWILDFMLYPCTFIRNDIHAVLENPVQDIYLGNSHARMNIDPDTMQEVTGRTGHNLAVGGEYAVDSYYLAKLLIEKSKPERIIYELSPGYFMTEKEEGNNYLLFYHEFPFSKSKLEYFKDTLWKSNFRTILFPWYEYPVKYELEKLSDTVYQKWNHNYDVSYLKGETQEYHESGFIERYPVDTSQLTMDEIQAFDSKTVKVKNVEYLKKLIELCQENDIEFIAVTTPMPIATLQQFQDNYNDAWQYFSHIFEEYNVPYLNFNGQLFPAFSHEIDAYTDFDGHMHGYAARDYSRVLAKILESV